MQTRVSSKGQVVIPAPVRRRLGIRAGDSLEIVVENDRVVLAPRTRRMPTAKIVRDPITGLPVLTCGPNGPVLTSERVRELLSDFP